MQKNMRKILEMVFLLIIKIILLAYNSDQRGGFIAGEIGGVEGELIKVELIDAGLQAKTDSTGKFIIKGIPAGIYDIKLSLVDYQTVIIKDVKIINKEGYAFRHSLIRSSWEEEKIIKAYEVDHIERPDEFYHLYWQKPSSSEELEDEQVDKESERDSNRTKEIAEQRRAAAKARDQARKQMERQSVGRINDEEGIVYSYIPTLSKHVEDNVANSMLAIRDYLLKL